MSEDTFTITSNWSQSNGSLSVTHVASAKDIDLDTMTPEACVLLSPLDGEDERCCVLLHHDLGVDGASGHAGENDNPHFP